MALFNSVEEFIEAQAKGTELGVDRYVKRFLTNNSGTGDLFMDETKTFRSSLLGKLTELVNLLKLKV